MSRTPAQLAPHASTPKALLTVNVRSATIWRTDGRAAEVMLKYKEVLFSFFLKLSLFAHCGLFFSPFIAKTFLGTFSFNRNDLIKRSAMYKIQRELIQLVSLTL